MVYYFSPYCLSPPAGSDTKNENGTKLSENGEVLILTCPKKAGWLKCPFDRHFWRFTVSSGTTSAFSSLITRRQCLRRASIFSGDPIIVPCRMAFSTFLACLGVSTIVNLLTSFTPVFILIKKGRNPYSHITPHPVIWADPSAFYARLTTKGTYTPRRFLTPLLFSFIAE